MLYGRSSLRGGNVPINTKTDSHTDAHDSVNIIPPVAMPVKMGRSHKVPDIGEEKQTISARHERENQCSPRRGP